MGFTNIKDENGCWKVIDPNTGVFLTVTGPGYPDGSASNYTVEVFLQNQRVTLRGSSGMKYCRKPVMGEKTPYDMNWQFFNLLMPPDLQHRKLEIFEYVVSALQVWGWNYKTENANSVTVKFHEYILGNDSKKWNYFFPDGYQC